MTTVQIYIEPDQGPIKPVQLDLLDIEQALQTARVMGRNKDQERLKLISEQIKKQLPHVQPESNATGLALIMARFSHVDQFSGVVLRLAGTIDADPSKPTSNGQLSTVKNELDKLTIEIRTLRGQLLNEQRANMNDKARVLQLEDAQRQLAQQRTKDYDKIALLQQQLQQVQGELQNAQSTHAREILRLQTEIDNAVRASAAMQIQCEQVTIKYEEEQKRRQQRDNEIEPLRRATAQAKEIEKQLRATIAEQTEELETLRTERYQPIPGIEPQQGGGIFEKMLE